MKFVDLQKEYEFFKEPIDLAVSRVLGSGSYLFGQELAKLESNFGQISNTKHCIGVKNCTDAIMMLVKQLLKSRPEATIILPNFGAYPTAVACRNFTPRLYYVDVDTSMTIDVNKLPKHIVDGILIVVNLFGNNCNHQIVEYAHKNNHILIEDCAQSTGSGSGSLGDYSVFSFYPTKPLASMGDGGMICSNKDISQFKLLRFYGQQEGEVKEVGINSRIDEIQSAIINSKIKDFNRLNQKRKEIALRYLKHISGIKVWSDCVFHQFVVMFHERDKIVAELSKRDIPYMIHYPNHVSEMDALKGIYNDVTFRVNDKIISLPCHPFLEEKDIQKIELFLKDFKDFEYVS